MRNFRRYNDINIVSSSNNTRGCCSSYQSKNNKFNFNKFKSNIFFSLNEVEHFLCNFKNFKKYMNLYKFFK